MSFNNHSNSSYSDSENNSSPEFIQIAQFTNGKAIFCPPHFLSTFNSHLFSLFYYIFFSFNVMKFISFIGFDAYEHKAPAAIHYLHQTFFPHLKLVQNIYLANIIFCNVTIDSHLAPTLRGLKSIKTLILYITEPIEHTYPITHQLLKDNIFHSVWGCIDHNPSLHHYKLPLYCFPEFKPTTFTETNSLLKTTNISNKQFCTLINKHDPSNTRTFAYNCLKNLQPIHCPGKLFNNINPNYLNSIGNIEFIKHFLFNICSENFICTTPGYITEKLMNCCLGLSIPIYCGNFDDIDSLIFNKNRIIFYNPNDPQSNYKLISTIHSLLLDKQKLIDFYYQDIFNPTAFDTIQTFYTSIHNYIKTITPPSS